MVLLFFNLQNTYKYLHNLSNLGENAEVRTHIHTHTHTHTHTHMHTTLYVYYVHVCTEVCKYVMYMYMYICNTHTCTPYCTYSIHVYICLPTASCFQCKDGSLPSQQGRQGREPTLCLVSNSTETRRPGRRMFPVHKAWS